MSGELYILLHPKIFPLYVGHVYTVYTTENLCSRERITGLCWTGGWVYIVDTAEFSDVTYCVYGRGL